MKSFWVVVLAFSCLAKSAWAAPVSGVMDWAFSGGSWSTDAVLIWQNGKIVAERYQAPYSAESKHRIWSISKSVMNALAGIAVYQGKLNRHELIAQYLGNSASQAPGISVSHLLEMTSGLTWDEGYINPLESLVILMLYGKGYANMGLYALSQGAKFKPGAKFEYSSGTSNILAQVLKKVVGENLSSYADRVLFKKLGIDNYTWEQDESGTPVTSSYLYLKAQDLLKFGRLYLENGIWAGERVLPADWVQYSWSPNPGDDGSGPLRPGKHWWINRSSPELILPRSWPEGPADTVAALGHSGQVLFIVPSRNAIFIRYGNDRGFKYFPKGEFLKRALECIP